MATLADLVVKLSADTAALERGLKGAGGHMSKFTNIAKTGALAGGAALAGLGVASLKMGMDFEKTMAEVKTLMPDISEKVFGEMKDDVLAFSKEMGIATDKAVPALYQAISAGVPRENVMEFMTVASKAAIGGVTELETAVDGITSVVNAYGAETISAQRAADIMFTGVRLGKTDFNQLSTSLFQVIPTAASLGISFEEVTGSLAALTAQGVPTSVATTQLRQAFVEASKSGTKLDAAIRELTGKGFGGLVAAGRTGQEVFQMLRESMPEQAFRDLFGSVEAMNAVLPLTGEGFESAAAAIAEAGAAAGAVEAAFETISETTAFKFNKAINTIKVEMTKLGAEALPILVEAMEKGGEALKKWWVEHGPEVEKTLKDLIGLLDDVRKAVTPFVEDFVSGTQTILDTLSGLAGWLATNKPIMIAAIIAIGAAIVVAFGPVSPAVAAIAGIIVLIGQMTQAWEEADRDFGTFIRGRAEAISIMGKAEKTAGEEAWEASRRMEPLASEIDRLARMAGIKAAPAMESLENEVARMRRTFIDIIPPAAKTEDELGGVGGAAAGAGSAMDKAAASALSLEAAMALANSMMDKAITTQQGLSRSTHILNGAEVELEDLLRIQIGVLEDQLAALDAAGGGQDTLAEAIRGAIQVLEDQVVALESGEEQLLLFGDAIGPVSAAIQEMNDAISGQIDLVKGLLSVQTEEEAQLEAEASRLKYEIELIDQVAGATRGLNDLEKILLSAAQSRVRSRADELEVTKEIIDALEEKRKAGEDLDWQEKKELKRSKERRDELDALIERDEALIERLEGLREAVTLEGKAAQGQTDILEEQLAVIEDAIEDIEAEKKARVDELNAMVQGRPTMEEWTRAIYSQAIETGLLGSEIGDIPPLLRAWWLENRVMVWDIAVAQSRLLIAQRGFVGASMTLASDWANAWTGAAGDIAAAMAGVSGGGVAAGVGVPELQRGGYITSPGLAYVHAGEAVVPAAGVSGGVVQHNYNIKFSGPVLGDHRQAEEFANFIETTLRRRLG